jgi:hypothetical protein
MLERVYQSATNFDFIHCHLDYYPFSLFSRQPTPFVTTLHGRLDLPEEDLSTLRAKVTPEMLSFSPSSWRPMQVAD